MTPDMARYLPEELKLFTAHALHVVTLYEVGSLSLWEAVGHLRETACRRGLIASYGVDEIEWIIGSEFERAGVRYGDIRPIEGVYP